MDINELNKKQLILLTLLITFVVSIGTGIVTVSLMKQMPQTVPQTINNVIQRTIEKVTTVDQTNLNKDNQSSTYLIPQGDVLVNIFRKIKIDATSEEQAKESVLVGQGVIISDTGIILVDSTLVDNDENYEIELGKEKFDISLLKKFNNGFTILEIGKEDGQENQAEEKN